jgi:hypothetical protein
MEGMVATYEMTCSCGDSYKAEGETKEAAVDSFMGQMTPEMVGAHMSEKHVGETPPTPQQAREGMLASARPV